jgi:FlaA1/EpsC-like NDP-sugar epimerase
MKKQLISLSRLGKQSLVLLVDSFSIALAIWLAYSIRLDRFHLPVASDFLVYGISLGVALPIFVRMGLYRSVFRYAGQHVLWVIVRAVFFYGLFFFAVIIFWGSLDLLKDIVIIPRSLGILQPIILLVLIVLSRSLARAWLAGHASISKKTQKRTLIYGAGVSGAQIGSSLQRSGQYYLVGYLDDDAELRHKTINGLTIYGIDEIDVLINEYGVTDILLALPSIQQSRRNEILSDLRRFHVHVRSLPSITDLAEGKVKVSDIRELDVTDLLGRNPVPPDKELFEKNIKNQVVMVTGAGGSIGSELTRQILFSRPKMLILLEQSEFALYDIDAELRARIKDENLDTQLVSLLGNVRQYDWLKKICNAWQINTVYHAAAYKHVPIVEQNVTEGVLNNVWGTLNAARASIESGVDQFVLISTDKAVRPTNVMGASKRLAEMVLQALASKAGICTQLCIVRFGNVLGSSGSVVPLFRSQINSGGPVTVTNPQVTRYFMTIPEAAQLVIQAGAMASISGAKGQGAVFVLDMGEPVKIVDLAQRMIELSGFSLQCEENPDGDIAIEIIGLRPGEKLYEELLIGNNPMPTEHPKIMKAQEAFKVWSEFEKELITLKESLNEGDARAVYEQLKNLVTGFTPDEKIVDWLTVSHKNMGIEKWH